MLCFALLFDKQIVVIARTLIQTLLIDKQWTCLRLLDKQWTMRKIIEKSINMNRMFHNNSAMLHFYYFFSYGIVVKVKDSPLIDKQ